METTKLMFRHLRRNVRAKVLTQVDLLDFLVTYEARIALLQVERMDSAAAAVSPRLAIFAAFAV